MVKQLRSTMVHSIRALLHMLWDRHALLLLGITAAVLLLAAQRPIAYHIAVGQEDGPGSDLPLIDGFFTPEHDPAETFFWRWTSERAQIHLPGLGQRPLAVRLRVLSVNDEVVRRGPQTLELWANGQHAATLPVRPLGATYHILLPPPADGSGNTELELRSATFIPAGDVRALGTPMDDVLVSGGGAALPAWAVTGRWLLVALLLWLAVRGAGFAPRSALVLLAPLAGLLGLAAALDPPRTALGTWPALAAVAGGWLLVLLLCGAVPRLARILALPLDRRLLRWLLLLALVVWSLRLGGKIYPYSMPGDIGFHSNRYNDVVEGIVLLLSRNRGVDFPYPPALYLLLQPFSLLGINPRVLLRISGALLDACSPFLVYAIAATAAQPRRAQPSDPRPAAWPVLAAGVYSLSASGFMTTWWNFSTHIFTQFTHLLLVALLVLAWRPSPRAARGVGAGAPLVLVLALTFLGHFGFWLNSSLVGGMGVLVAYWFAARSGRTGWWRLEGRTGVLLASFVVAEVACALLFYSGYGALFAAQARAATSGGLNGLAGRQPASTAVLWSTLWDAGLRTHFGLFPVPLACAGLALLWRRKRSGMLLFLMASTFCIALGFAVLPFVSGSTLSTRWLMFSAWAIAVGAAWSADALWRRGRPARLLVLVMGGYMIWITVSQWVGALAWRIRPPEPF